jgi:hypothetical protein
VGFPASAVPEFFNVPQCLTHSREVCFPPLGPSVGVPELESPMGHFEDTNPRDICARVAHL